MRIRQLQSILTAVLLLGTVPVPVTTTPQPDNAGRQFMVRTRLGSGYARYFGTQRVPVRLIVSNPSSYFYFTDWRPDPQPNCSDFDRWRYGLAGAPRYVTGTAAELEARYVRRRVVYLMGAADTNPHEDDLDAAAAARRRDPTALRAQKTSSRTSRAAIPTEPRRNTPSCAASRTTTGACLPQRADSPQSSAEASRVARPRVAFAPERRSEPYCSTSFIISGAYRSPAVSVASSSSRASCPPVRRTSNARTFSSR